jgi:hypothetical protein
MTKQTLAERVAAMEAEIRYLKSAVERLANQAVPWWEQIVGIFGDDPAFAEAMRLGRQYRESLRPGSHRRAKR